MKKTMWMATAMGLALVFGTAMKSEAICLFDCGTDVKVEAKGAGRDLRENSDNVSGAKAEGIGNTAVQDVNIQGPGNVVAGTTISSGNKVNVGVNQGDMNISSGNNIIGSMDDHSNNAGRGDSKVDNRKK